MRWLLVVLGVVTLGALLGVNTLIHIGEDLRVVLLFDLMVTFGIVGLTVWGFLGLKRPSFLAVALRNEREFRRLFMNQTLVDESIMSVVRDINHTELKLEAVGQHIVDPEQKHQMRHQRNVLLDRLTTQRIVLDRMCTYAHVLKYSVPKDAEHFLLPPAMRNEAPTAA